MRYTAVTQIPSIAIKQGVVPEGAQITIAIPTYKRAHLLRETLESCLAQQTNCPFAIMVVDNNPERECETEQLLQEYKAIPHLFYYKNTENVGMTGNWNKLFELSQTNFVVMLHDDDLLYNDYVETLGLILKKIDYKVDSIYLEKQTFDIKEHIPIKKNNSVKTICLKPYDFQFDNIANITGALFRKETLIALDGFDETYYPCFDYELYVRLASKGISYKILGYSTLCRLSENESIKFSTALQMIESNKKIIKGITKNYLFIYQWFLKHFFKAYDCFYIKGYKSYFKVNDPQVDTYIEEKETKIQFIDRLAFKLGMLMAYKIFPLLKRKKIIELNNL